MDATTVRALDDVARFDLEVDVLVVGLGAAGACAAVEAVRAGADVCVLERASAGGGTSALSGGLLYLGGGTPIQQKLGHDDSPAAMERYLLASSGPGPDAAKIRLFCEQSVEHYHWLVDAGVPFNATWYDGYGEPPGDEGLTYSGSEDAWPFCDIAPPAPRGHCPAVRGKAGGFLMEKLLAAAQRVGPRIEGDASCEALVVDRERRVVGAVASRAGGVLRVRARRGVVLAAGGFVQSRAMLEQYAPLLRRCKYRLGCEGDDGRGIRMGLAAGGATVRMDAGFVVLPFTPPRVLIQGLLVNGHGQRFVNEDAYYGRIGELGLLQQDGRVYLVVDDACFARPEAGMAVCASGGDVAELEAELGLPAAALQQTVDFYNAYAARGEDPLFHKARRHLRPLDRPPFGAIDCTTDNALWACFTLGGLHTDPDGKVLDADGAPVPGLFAAGRTTSGLAAQGYSSGVSLSDATFFGRRAGASAARG